MNEVIDDGTVGIGSRLVSQEKNKATFLFLRMSASKLATELNSVFVNEGYKLEFGTLEKGQYGKGNAALRILFGAFVKRFCWNFEILPEGGGSRLVFTKEAKGYAGGIIGVNQVNKEFKRVIELIKQI